MDKKTLELMLRARAKSEHPPEVTVRGVSMLPFLKEGDAVTVKRRESYEIGDILVYPYKDEGMLVHRLLKNENGRLYCKGDNAFRMEDITHEQAIGKVEAVNGVDTVQPQGRTLDLLCRMSLNIHRKFIKMGRQIEPVMRTYIYIMYKRIFHID